MVILGSTGSIGVSALQVARKMKDRCRVVGLAAHRNLSRLEEQIREFSPEVVSVWDESDARQLRSRGYRSGQRPLEVLSGEEGLIAAAAWGGSNFLLSSVVGAVGLKPLLAALRAGRTVALANKEALVMAGDLVMAETKRWNATLLPVDSEHSAIFQCLTGARSSDIKRLILTASGGPFYRHTGSLENVTVEQALAHPTWKMGRKITIDSATLMNKGLETIEAGILFNLPIDRVDVLIHPQSIVHSLVEFVDGAMLAQLSEPDMSLPIQYAITHPERRTAPMPFLDLARARALEFYTPDFSRFPCLTLAREAARRGGCWPTVLNAADEVAVYAFLEGRIGFASIPELIERTLNRFKGGTRATLSAVLEADRWGRQTAREYLEKWTT